MNVENHKNINYIYKSIAYKSNIRILRNLHAAILQEINIYRYIYISVFKEFEGVLHQTKSVVFPQGMGGSGPPTSVQMSVKPLKSYYLYMGVYHICIL